jgi:hypothetical protein
MKEFKLIHARSVKRDTPRLNFSGLDGFFQCRSCRLLTRSKHFLTVCRNNKKAKCVINVECDLCETTIIRYEVTISYDVNGEYIGESRNILT